MIKAINISPLNTSTEVYFDCGKCGEKATISLGLINVDHPEEIEVLKKEKCPYCGNILGRYSLPRLNNIQINDLNKVLFKDKAEEYPLGFYLHLLFDEKSPHATNEKLSERIESLNQFLTESKDMADNNGTNISMLFTQLLDFLKTKEYISSEEYSKEYDICLQSVIKHYK